MRPRALLVLCTAALALGCGSLRRPPAVAGAVSGTVGGEPAAVALEPEKAVEAGPDVQPIREDTAAGQEILAGPSGEGGPLADVYFEYDAASLTESAIATLERHAQWLRQNAAARAAIEGHCDQRGTVEYNLALGDLRAQAVREHLVSLGVSADRLTAVSYGKERPLDPQLGEQAFAKNRRAHFVVSR